MKRRAFSLRKNKSWADVIAATEVLGASRSLLQGGNDDGDEKRVLEMRCKLGLRTSRERGRGRRGAMKNYNNYHFERILFIRGHCAETLFDKLHACRRQIIVWDKNEAAADFRAAICRGMQIFRAEKFSVCIYKQKKIRLPKKARNEKVRCLITNA